MEQILGSLGGPGGGVAIAEVAIQGPPLQIPVASGTTKADGGVAINLPATVPANGSAISAVFPTFGCSNLAIGLTSSQAGQMSLQRYLDAAGTVPNGAPITATLTATNAQVLTVNDGVACRSAKLTVTNTSGTIANISAFAGLMQAR